MDYAWMRWIRNLRPARLPVMRWVKCLSRINGEKNENDRKTFVIDSYTVRMPRVIRSRLYIERLVPFQRKKHSDRSPPRRQATAKSNENSVPLDIDDDHMYTRFILFLKHTSSSTMELDQEFRAFTYFPIFKKEKKIIKKNEKNNRTHIIHKVTCPEKKKMEDKSAAVSTETGKKNTYIFSDGSSFSADRDGIATINKRIYIYIYIRYIRSHISHTHKHSIGW